MANVIRFRTLGKEYPLSILDRDGNKWVTAQQVGEAIGTKQIRRLVHELKENGELQEGKHLSSVTERNSGAGNPTRLILSGRGVIRVAMRSQGRRAKEFRDWAEDVLYEVMMTGSYAVPGRVSTESTPFEELAGAREQGLKQGLAIAAIADKHRIDIKTVSKLCYFRRSGATQKEAGMICGGLSVDQVQTIERGLRKEGIVFKPIQGLQRDKMYLDKIGSILKEADIEKKDLHPVPVSRPSYPTAVPSRIEQGLPPAVAEDTTVVWYITERCEFGPEKSISPASTMYPDYRVWCHKKKAPSLGRNFFYRRLFASFPHITRRHGGGKIRRYLSGLAIKGTAPDLHVVKGGAE